MLPQSLPMSAPQLQEYCTRTTSPSATAVLSMLVSVNQSFSVPIQPPIAVSESFRPATPER